MVAVALALGSLPAGEGTAGAAAALPPGFSSVLVASGFTKPTAFDIAGDGRVFVAEQRGTIKVLDTVLDPTPTLLADLRTAVHHHWDRGLLGLVADPAFPERPYLYALYDHDAPPGGVGPVWGEVGADSDGCHPVPQVAIEDGCPAGTRVSRLEVDGSAVVAERVLVDDVCMQVPSHGGGGLAFGGGGGGGGGGDLYAAFGDGAWSFSGADHGQHGTPPNPCGDPPGPAGTALSPPTAEGGSLRSQDLRTSGDPLGFGGSVVRIDPDGGEPPQVVAHGLRNPFRLAVRPGTDEVWVGDVGFDTWEELNRVVPGGAVENLGWPCFEGGDRHPAFDALDLDLCEDLYAEGATGPDFAYRHSDPVVAGEACGRGGSAVTGAAFAGSGAYPAPWAGALAFADAVRGCIWALPPGPDGAPDVRAPVVLLTGVPGIVDLKAGPGGELYYLAQSDRSLRRIRHTGANVAPTAVLDADPAGGPAPLTVTLDGSRSSDPDAGDGLDLSWDLDGDGVFGDASTPTAVASFADPGEHVVRLRVRDDDGAVDVAERTISVGEALVVDIAAPAPSTRWSTGDEIHFSGSALDPASGPLGADALTWSLRVHHCHAPQECHVHHLRDLDGVAEGVVTAPAHGWPAHFELRLTAEGPGGVRGEDSVVLDPVPVEVTVASEPAGAALRLGGVVRTAPFTTTAVAGSPLTVTAPTSAELGGVPHDFVSWSDGGDRTHTLHPRAATTLTATYAPGNRPPVAAAGADRSVPSRAGFVLDASGSSDPDGDPLTFRWRQVSGPAAVLRPEDEARATVDGVRGPATLVFEVTVTDPHGRTATDLVTVTVGAK